MQVIRITFALLLLGVTACGSGEDDVARTSPEVLTEALASAEAGTTIHLEATTYAGSYQIPAGVTLQGIDGTVIAPPPGGLGISLVPGSDTQPTSLKAVRIESDGIGFHSAGSGHIAVEDVYVHSPKGVSAVLSEVQGTLTNVQLTGCIDGPDSSLLTLGATFSSEMLSVVGLAAVNANLTMRFVDIQGFVGYGLATYGSTISWDTGTVKYFVGVGLMSEKSTVTVADVAITEAFRVATRVPSATALGLSRRWIPSPSPPG